MDISDYIEADLGRNQEYWKVQCEHTHACTHARAHTHTHTHTHTLLFLPQDMQIICEDELHKLKQLNQDDPGMASTVLLGA